MYRYDSNQIITSISNQRDKNTIFSMNIIIENITSKRYNEIHYII